MEQLEGKVAVITGGGSGIGQGMAQACADVGMRVVIADIEEDAAERVANELRERGAEAIAVRTDVTDRAALDELADAAYEAFGAVHLLCNNAGVISVGEIASTTPEDWQWLFGVNVFGVVHGIQAFVPRMREQIAASGGEAHIVNTGSMSSISATRAVQVGVYCATKHAVLGLSETLRNELEGDGIGVSILCPGGVATQLFAADRNLPDELRGRVTPPVEERTRGRADASSRGGPDCARRRPREPLLDHHPPRAPRHDRAPRRAPARRLRRSRRQRGIARGGATEGAIGDGAA